MQLSESKSNLKEQKFKLLKDSLVSLLFFFASCILFSFIFSIIFYNFENSTKMIDLASLLSLFSSGFTACFIASKITVLIFRNKNRLKSEKFFSSAQVAGGAAMAFMHGAQDGQKFMAIFLLGQALANGNSTGRFEGIPPMWLMVLCSLVMGLGTSIGGYKIIKSVGMDMVKLKPYQGFSADFAATLCLLLSSLTGIPVSTTHTKTTAIMGVGAARRMSNVNWDVVKDLVLTWVFTFPGCGLLGYIMATIFLKVF